MDNTEEIKSKIAIEDLVGQYVQLKKAGRNFKGLCPFHSERTPSFVVSPDKGMAYCFGCKKGGDHFKFIEEIEGLDFVGALKFLAEKTGVVLPHRHPEVERSKKTERDHLIEIHEKTAEFFENNLWKESCGKSALKYLRDRKLKDETIKKGRIGFASGEKRDALYSFLLQNNFTRNEILASGLAMASSTDLNSCYDRFRNQIMFPITNLAGNVCAFGGRAILAGDEPKYLNSPETPVYHKSSLLYLLSEARVEIRKKDSAIIVEGYMDALKCHEAGYSNAVASSGTALTAEHLALIKRFTKNIIFSFDQDNAGKLAAERSIEMGFQSDLALKVAVWESSAKDPDECLREEPKEFARAVAEAMPAGSYLLSYYSKTFDIQTAAGKKNVVDKLVPFWAKVASPVELDEWIKITADKLNASVSSLYDELKRFQGKQKNGSRALPVSKGEETPYLGKSNEYLLGLLLTYPETISIANQLVSPEDFDDIELQNIYRFISSEYNLTLGNQKISLTENELNRKNILSLAGETINGEMNAVCSRDEVIAATKAIVLQKLNREKRSVLQRLKNSAKDEKQALLEAYQEILTREQNLYGQKN